MRRRLDAERERERTDRCKCHSGRMPSSVAPSGLCSLPVSRLPPRSAASVPSRPMPICDIFEQTRKERGRFAKGTGHPPLGVYRASQPASLPARTRGHANVAPTFWTISDRKRFQEALFECALGLVKTDPKLSPRPRCFPGMARRRVVAV